MQRQFNNSPLEGGDQAPESKERILSFLFFLFCHWRLLFSVFKTAHPAPSIPTQTPWEGREDWKERGGLFSTFCFLTWHTHTHTHSSCGGMLLRLLLIGCHWQNGLCHRQSSPLRLQAVFTGASYRRSRGTNTNNNNSNTRDRQAAVILPRYGKACWTEIMASRPACWLHAGPAKLPELSLMITAREH